MYQIYLALYDLYVWIIASPDVGIYQMQASLYLWYLCLQEEKKHCMYNQYEEKQKRALEK
jgi:hypothetical protein